MNLEMTRIITDNPPLDLLKINYFQIISDKINTDEKTPQTFYS